MKVTLQVLLSLSAAAGAIATATETNQVSNTTADESTNTIATAGARKWTCFPPKQDGLHSWYYNSKADGPYLCTKKNDNADWAMLNAYRSGGTLNVHWKYTNDLNDKECLNNWNYYSDDGQQLVATISGRTTTLNDSKHWCPLPVYRQGGVKGKQWGACKCDDYINT